jgi:hypothetical protein
VQPPPPKDILDDKYGGSGTLNKGKEKSTSNCQCGIFAYRKMPFGMRNGPATYQWCMLSIFSDTIERARRYYDKRLVRNTSTDEPMELRKPGKQQERPTESKGRTYFE